MNYMIYAMALLMAIFGYRRLLFALKFMQQDSYYNYRLFRFAYRERNLIDTRVTIPVLFTALTYTIVGNGAVLEPWIMIVPIIALAIQIFRETNPLKGGIKPLVMTPRAKRIFYSAFALWLCAIAIPFILHSSFIFYYAAMVLFAPIFLMAGNFIMKPVERIISQRFVNEAKAILKKYNPTIIGITGSFGKTSLKNILHHVLDSYSTSFATKRSINTLMGIVRVIREEMTSAPKYFVAEMGIGDTGQMPDLVKFLDPDYGIITAIGSAHLGNFGTIEKIAREKFRLSKQVAKNGGQTILATENIPAVFIDKYRAANDILFSNDVITNVKQTIDGLSFTLNYDGKKHEITAPVYGAHNAQNISLAFMMARILGVDADSIILSLKTLKQTEHRLEVRKEGAFTVMDDAFNSNVKGFLSALETGAAIKGNNRFIIITPGMVDLGTAHTEHHRKAGIKANTVCDVVIAVNPTRIRDFTNEIAKDKLVEVESLAKAREWLASNGRPGDIVLYENDLVDVYIEKIKI